MTAPIACAGATTLGRHEQRAQAAEAVRIHEAECDQFGERLFDLGTQQPGAFDQLGGGAQNGGAEPCAAAEGEDVAGARALGLDRVTGSIVPGKAADLAAVELRRPFLVPCYDPVSHLAYAAGREDVSHVWVAGKAVVADRQLQNGEPGALDTRIELWQNALARAES